MTPEEAREALLATLERLRATYGGQALPLPPPDAPPPPRPRTEVEDDEGQDDERSGKAGG